VRHAAQGRHQEFVEASAQRVGGDEADEFVGVLTGRAGQLVGVAPAAPDTTRGGRLDPGGRTP
jgi:hypothetical protein